jgi:hypothetical protein
MKKASIVLLLFLIANLGFSQIPGLTLGPKIGYNSNRLTTDFDSITSDAKGSLQYGAFIRIGKKFYVQPEVNYVLKGGKIKFGSLGIQELKLKSVTVPILFGIRPINAGVFNFRLMAGPTMSFITETTIDTPNGLIDAFPIKSKDDLKETMWSLQLGGGIDVMFMTLDVRYELGVENLYTGKQDFTLKNNLFNVSLGIKLL